MTSTTTIEAETVPVTTAPSGTATVTSLPQVDYPLPAWLPYGCPAWCGYGDEHDEDTHYDDRNHGGFAFNLVLTAFSSAISDDRDIATERPELNMNLVQHYREVEPRIWIGFNGTNKGVHVTISEAEKAARHLLDMVAAAHAAAAR
ncbi:DUF6907 domain-containing protein [Actinomadura rupiterrae]|uniref:DUF6907 domain-containing protein n=1 Tax=Actinomadura rupiterrae TaxID=559627 RepID=UPI0020A3328B|nr:hypothetical protein [Actinomadura rupiterrae]MCP2336120.1 hypothetical protein [Actinomadura rupiterrae]